MNKHKYSFSLVFILLLYGLSQPAVSALEQKAGPDPLRLSEMTVAEDTDADQALELRSSGKIMPLEDIIRKLRSEYPGRIIETELDEKNGRYIYELELVDEQGVVWELETDASTGEVLKYEQDD